MTDTATRIRERLAEMVIVHGGFIGLGRWDQANKAADAIMREFALRPISSGTVGEDGEVTSFGSPAGSKAL